MDTIIAYLSIFASAMGISWVSRDYLSSLLGGLILRRVKKIKPGTRIKVLTANTIKGDILNVGLFRTTLVEVGEGSRLPSIQTGRELLIPNSTLVNSPVLVYRDKIIDQVVAYVERDPQRAIQCMKEAMKENNVKIKEVDLYQSEGKFEVYGIFESEANHMSDTRSEILRRFLSKFTVEKAPLFISSP